MKIFAIAARTALTLALVASFLPLAAQTVTDPNVMRFIVFGDAACPTSTEGEIVVCARKDESEQYRIPEALREIPVGPSDRNWTERVSAYEYVGKTGTSSCSPSGAGGFSGCLDTLLQKAYSDGASPRSLTWRDIINSKNVD